MSKRVIFFSLICLLLSHGQALAQFSLTVTAGAGKNTHNEFDPWALDNAWATQPSQLPSTSVPFCTHSNSTALSAGLSWETSKYFSMGLIYQYIHFNSSITQRNGSMSSVGVQLKINFVRNTRKVVPFLTASFLPLNKVTLHQDQVTSAIYSNQTQPSLDISYSTGIGLIGDLGVEIKLTRGTSLLVMGGLRGISIDNSQASDAIHSKSYGNGFISPGNLDGVFRMQGTLGMKVYLGRGTGKKRDF